MAARGAGWELRAGQLMFWLVAAAAGAVALWIPELALPLARDPTKFLLRCGAFFVLGAILGLLAPNRPWRWAIASVLLAPPAEWLLHARPGVSADLKELIQVFSLTREQLERYFVLALAALVGSLAGGMAASPK